MELVRSKPHVEVDGEGSAELPSDRSNLVYHSAVHLFQEVDSSFQDLFVSCHNKIPVKRGLGSSASAIVGGLVAANDLVGNPLTEYDILLMAVELEGHPDNVTAALFGGARIVVPGKQGIITSAVTIPQDLNVVLYIPENAISTVEARSVLPDKVSYEDAVFNMGRVALLVNALSGDRVQDLSVGTEDRLHQPYRQNLFPAMRLIIREALKAGALGAFVSGSGSTVLAFARGREMSIAYEMAEAARKANAPGRTIITSPSDKGAYVVKNPREGFVARVHG